MKSKDEIDAFQKLILQMEKILNDFKDLSKKKPDGAVNTFKLQFVNKLLGEANNILDKTTKPFDDFDKFSEDEVPTNSDVVLILTQYMAGLQNFALNNIASNPRIGHNAWIIKGKVSNIEADKYHFQNLRY